MKKQSEEEEDFGDPSLVHDLPDRTPGEILCIVPTTYRLVALQQLLLQEMDL